MLCGAALLAVALVDRHGNVVASESAKSSLRSLRLELTSHREGQQAEPIALPVPASQLTYDGATGCMQIANVPGKNGTGPVSECLLP